MFSRIVKYSCVAALVLATAFRLEGTASILLQFVVCGGATFVMMQAVRSRKYLWGAAFALIALYFNPVIPITVAWAVSVPISLASLVVFLASVFYPKPTPRMSLATITDLPGRGESL
jgi:hypothetical protein